MPYMFRAVSLHRDLENCMHSTRYMSSLLAATASVSELELEFTYASGSGKQA